MIPKPITVAKHEFTNKLTDLINESGLPPFILEPIIKDTLIEIRHLASRQLSEDMARYTKDLEAEGTAE